MSYTYRGKTPEARAAWDAKRLAIKNQREAILAMDLEHVPAAAIASALGLTRGQVSGVLFRSCSGHVDRRSRTMPAKDEAVLATHTILKPDGAPLQCGDLLDGQLVSVDCETWVATPRKVATPRITMAELTTSMCHYPFGDPKGWRTNPDDDFHFCGKPTEDLGPYCFEHRVLCADPKSFAKSAWTSSLRR